MKMPHRSQALLLVLVLLACAPAVRAYETSDPREGSGTQGSSTRTLPPFSRIELRSAEALAVVRSDTPAVTVTGDDNLLELITTEVRGETLIVDARGSYRTRQPLVVTVAAAALERLIVAGSGKAVVADLDAPRFELEINGSGSAEATGVVEVLDIEVNGSGSAAFGRVKAVRSDVEINGSGSVILGHTDALSGEVNGSGTLFYEGKPKPFDVEVNGSGRVRRR